MEPLMVKYNIRMIIVFQISSAIFLTSLVTAFLNRDKSFVTTLGSALTSAISFKFAIPKSCAAPREFPADAQGLPAATPLPY